MAHIGERYLLLEKIGLFRVARTSIADVGAIAPLDYFPFV